MLPSRWTMKLWFRLSTTTIFVGGVPLTDIQNAVCSRNKSRRAVWSSIERSLRPSPVSCSIPALSFVSGEFIASTDSADRWVIRLLHGLCPGFSEKIDPSAWTFASYGGVKEVRVVTLLVYLSFLVAVVFQRHEPKNSSSNSLPFPTFSN